ncbi:MAG TPA: 2-oxoglutarate and iron-dependent oxygenase domain-containing protein [Alphaproteobacteria bacterium]
MPVIDIAPSLWGTAAARQSVAREIRRACETIGFLTITGHGVSQHLIDDADGLSREFFDLPLDEKLKIDIGTGKRGYRRIATSALAGSLGTDTPPDLREQIVSGQEAAAGDPYYQRPGAAAFFPPNVWPQRPMSLAPVWRAYYHVCTHLATHLMRLFALALDLPEWFFEDKVDRHITQLISVNYPAQPEAPLPGQLRAGAHTDFGSLTLLATDGTPGGLQVMMPNGEWHDIVPVKGAYIVNLGDLMAQWTNDRWRSTLHRVVNPPSEVAADSRRHSMVFFHQPNFDALIECLPTCVAPGERPKYRPVTSGEHLADKLAKIRGKKPAPEPAVADNVTLETHHA